VAIIKASPETFRDNKIIPSSSGLKFKISRKADLNPEIMDSNFHGLPGIDS